MFQTPPFLTPVLMSEVLIKGLQLMTKYDVLLESSQSDDFVDLPQLHNIVVQGKAQMKHFLDLISRPPGMVQGEHEGGWNGMIGCQRICIISVFFVCLSVCCLFGHFFCFLTDLKSLCRLALYLHALKGWADTMLLL